METNNLLNDIIKAEGTIVEELNTKSPNEVIETVDNVFENNYEPMRDTKYELNFAYGMGGSPLPGQEVLMNTDAAFIKDENKINEHLVQLAALFKLQREREEFRNKSDEEKIKEYLLKTIYKQQETEYINKYGYNLSGLQKRKLRKSIETAYKKGKYKLTPKQKDDLLYELNLSSNSKNPNENNPMINNTNSTSLNIRALMG